jgi:hypothetical protein
MYHNNVFGTPKAEHTLSVDNALCAIVSISLDVKEICFISAIHHHTITLCALALHLNCASNWSFAICCSSAVKFPSNNNIISGLAEFL